MEANWNTLPNEIRAMIVRNTDIQTGLALRRCGFDEISIVRSFAKFNVNITVTYTERRRMKIELKNADNFKKNALLYWDIIPTENKKDIKIVQQNHRRKVVYESVICRKSLSSVTSRVVKCLAMDPSFKVEQLELQLNKFKGKIDFSVGDNGENPKKVEVENLFFNNCRYSSPLVPLMMGSSFVAQKFTTATIEDRRVVRKAATIANLTRKNAPISSLIVRSYSSVFPDNYMPSTLQEAKEKLGEFIVKASVFPKWVEDGIIESCFESKIIVTMAMFMRAVFCENPSVVTYLPSRWIRDYKEEFLEENGDNEDAIMNTDQIALLTAFLIQKLSCTDFENVGEKEKEILETVYRQTVLNFVPENYIERLHYEFAQFVYFEE